LGLVGRKTISAASGSAGVVLGNAASSSRAGSRSVAGRDRLGNDRGLDTGGTGDSQSGSSSDSDGLAVDSDNCGCGAVGNVISGEDGGVSRACRRSDEGQRSSSRNARGATGVGVSRVASIGGACRRSDQSQRSSSGDARGATRVRVGRVASVGGSSGPRAARRRAG